jgi:hypothetical protein
MSQKKPEENSAKGRDSFDATLGNSLIQFFNRNVTPYPTEVGGPKFDLVPVTKQKDVMVNVARMHAQQEYDRIMQLVEVLQKQANHIKYRLELTDLVHKAEYAMQLYHGQIYWLCFDHRKNVSRLVSLGPKDWSTGAPQEWEYLCRIKWLGDHTWVEVDDLGNPLA